MKYLTTSALLLTILANAPAFAGGVVLSTEETTEVAPAHDRKVPAWVFLALGAVVVAAIANGGSEVCTTEEVPVVPEQPSGGC